MIFFFFYLWEIVGIELLLLLVVVALCVFLLHRFLGGVGAVCARQRTDPLQRKGLLPRSSIAVNRNVITQRRFPFFFKSFYLLLLLNPAHRLW